MSHDRARSTNATRRLKHYLLTASALAIVGAVGTTAFAAEQSNATDQQSKAAKSEQPVGEIVSSDAIDRKLSTFLALVDEH